MLDFEIFLFSFFSFFLFSFLSFFFFVCLFVCSFVPRHRQHMRERRLGTGFEEKSEKKKRRERMWM